MYIDFIKMLAALAAVLGLLFLLMKLLRHKIMPKQGLITLIHYYPFAVKKGIAVVKIAKQYYALGVADGGISLITKLEGEEIEVSLKENMVECSDKEGFGLKRMLQEKPWRLPWK